MFIRRKKVKFKKRPKQKKKKLTSLENLPPSDIPKYSWLKAELQNWYVRHKIDYDEEALKIDLWKGIKNILNI